ncbi:MAG: LysR family transcriptional regulator [Clostridiales bacterium]|nr:LysR family transcriptional regulator [Clostridiales bacterium]
MDIRSYEYMVAIAEHGSISRAAEQLFITQSALSKFLQRTEQMLGLRLFQRLGNHLVLTEIGRQYVETGRKIILLDQELEDEMAMERARQKGQIRLGCGMGRTSFILGDILPAFYRKYPDIQIYTRSETGQVQLDELQHNRLDLGLLSDLERLSGLEYRIVDVASLVVAAPPGSSLAVHAKHVEGAPYPVISRETLEQVPLIIMRSTTRSGNLVRRVLAQYRLNLRIILEVSDVRSLMDAVEKGLGAGMFISVPRGSRSLEYFSIEGLELPEQSTYLVFRSDKKLSPAMRYLAELILGKPL